MSTKTPISKAVGIACRTPGETNILSLHDAHLGHDNTTSAEIIDAWRTAMPDDDAFLKTLDYFFIPGDLFDRLLHLPNHGVPLIRMELRRWLTLAEFYGFGIFVLEGTPSHDWKQSKMIESVAVEMGFKGELRYVDRLCVERTRKGDTLLFVPDEWKANHHETYLEAQAAIQAFGLEQVDYCLFHGQFEYQFPELSLPCHNSDDWQKLVKHYLFAGHIHKPSIHGKILVAGSFDRLRHNEEHPKGHLRVTVREHGEDTVTFVENKRAKVYLTENVKDVPIEHIFEHMVDFAQQFPLGSFLRMSGLRSQGLKAICKLLEKLHPQYRWSIVTEGKSAADLHNRNIDPIDVRDDTPVVQRAQLTKPVMFDEIVARLPTRGLDAETCEIALRMAREVLCPTL
jgi:hypothetical protein